MWFIWPSSQILSKATKCVFDKRQKNVCKGSVKRVFLSKKLVGMVAGEDWGN